MMVKKEMIVEKMSCNHCKTAVENAVLALPGVADARVDLAAKTLTLEYDENQVSEAMLKEAIEEEGFFVG